MLTALKVIFAVATGLVGGYVNRSLGAEWGIPMALGYLLGATLWRYLK